MYDTFRRISDTVLPRYAASRILARRSVRWHSELTIAEVGRVLEPLEINMQDVEFVALAPYLQPELSPAGFELCPLARAYPVGHFGDAATAVEVEPDRVDRRDRPRQGSSAPHGYCFSCGLRAAFLMGRHPVAAVEQITQPLVSNPALAGTRGRPAARL
jgi:hypothetical protein